MRPRRAAALLALALGACGDDRDGPRAVPVGEAPLPASVGDAWEAPRTAADTSDRLALPPLPSDDTLAVDTLAAGPLMADGLRPDTLVAPPPAARPEAPAAPPEPAFGPVWEAFGAETAPPALRAAAARALAPPFGDAVGALTPRDFARDGSRRHATVRVGFDDAGAVVPQETAARDSTVHLVFDLVDGAYRLADIRFSG